jgi:hypothetical protein
MAITRSLLSVVTVASVGFTCKLFLRSGLCSVNVNGLDILKSIIDDPDRRAAGRGVVTGALNQEAKDVVVLIMQVVCNHISTCI